jgi:proline iminopeptidase
MSGGWEDLIDDADHAELMVLTACRMWRYSTERIHCSKTAAGRWALGATGPDIEFPVTRDVEERVRLDDGVVLWTATGGSGSVPVVLCHGGAGLWDYLQPVAESLSSVARVHRWEQRGCGRSDRVGPYSIARYIADLECLRRHFRHERWFVVGHSWGAGLALRYALAHPNRVLGVLYISGTGFGQAWRGTYHREADRRLTAKQRERRDELERRRRTEAEEREWRVLSYMPDVGDPDRAVPIAAEFADVPYAINFDCNTALNDEEKRTDEANLLERCRALDVPVLAVHGSRDPRPSSALEAMLAALPCAELVLMDGVGHLPWLEDPVRFGRIARGLVVRIGDQVR